MKDSLRKLREQMVVDASRAQAKLETRRPLLFPIAFLIVFIIILVFWWTTVEGTIEKLETQKDVPTKISPKIGEK